MQSSSDEGHREAHEVDVFDPALLQVMRKTGVSSMGVIEKCTVTINVSFGAF
jgi:hypothetical protein